jgi:hypothetical protein
LLGHAPIGWSAQLSHTGSPQTLEVYAICASP